MPSYRKSKKENQRNVENFYGAGSFTLFMSGIGLIMLLIVVYIAYLNYKFIKNCDTLPSKSIHYVVGLWFNWFYFLARKFGIVKCPPKIQKVGF